MGAEPTKLLEKILIAGIFGLEQNQLTDEELKVFCELDCVEVLHKQTVTSRKNEIDILERDGIKVLDLIGDSNTKEVNALRNILDEYMLRLNAYTWRLLLVGSGLKFQKHEYFFVLDKLIQSKDFLEYNFLKTKFLIRTKPWRKFFLNLAKNNIIDIKQLNKSTFLRLKTEHDRIVLHGLNQEQGKRVKEDTLDDASDIRYPNVSFLNDKPLYLQVQDMIYSKTGTTSTALGDRFGLDIKFGLKILEALKINDSCIHSKDFSFGKVTKYVFYADDPNHPDLKTPTEIMNEACISREEKLRIFRNMAKELKCFPPTIQNRRIYGELLKSKFVPDKKNFIKLARECGCIVKLESNQNKKITLIAYSEKDFSEYSPIEHVAPAYDEELVVSKRKRLFNRFVMQKAQVALDNGYLQEIHSKYRLFSGICSNIEDDTDCIFLNQDIVQGISIRNMAKMFMYPFIIKIVQKTITEYRSHKFLIESTDVEHIEKNLVKSDLNFRDLQTMELKNLECTNISQLYKLLNFETLLKRFKVAGLIEYSNHDNGYLIKVKDTHESVTKKPKFTSKKIPHVEYCERVKMYSDIAKKFTQKSPAEVYNYFKEKYDPKGFSEISFLIKNCFKRGKVSKFSFFLKPQLSYSGTCMPTTKAYRYLKNMLLDHQKLKIANLDFANERDLKGLIEKGQSDHFLKMSHCKKYISLKSHIINKIRNSSIKTYISDDHFWNTGWSLPQHGETIVNIGARVLFKSLVQFGTLSYQNAAQKTKFLLEEDLNDIIFFYKDFFEQVDSQGNLFITLKLPTFGV